MKVKKVVVGYLSTNCYLLIKNKKCLIVDPGEEANKIITEIGDNQVIGILITHHHSDHIGAVSELQNYYKCDVYDNVNLNEGNIAIDEFEMEIIYTPGHTDDSITIYFDQEQLMFTGDFLFKGTVGRYDLPTGDYEILMNSLNKIKGYNKEITIYPGHGDESKIDFEIHHNPFLQ